MKFSTLTNTMTIGINIATSYFRRKSIKNWQQRENYWVKQNGEVWEYSNLEVGLIIKFISPNHIFYCLEEQLELIQPLDYHLKDLHLPLINIENDIYGFKLTSIHPNSSYINIILTFSLLLASSHSSMIARLRCLP